MKALRKADQAGVRSIHHVERQAVKRARRVVEKALWNASLVNDDGCNDAGEAPSGWTEQERRMARDARQCERNVPFYMKLAMRVVESADRVAAARDQGPRISLNIGPVVQVQPAEYKVIDVDSKEG